MSGRRRAPARPRSEGGAVAEFIESCCRITKGPTAGELIRLRPWQRELLDDLFRLRPDGLRQYRRALVGLPRKNGKSALASAIALYLLLDVSEPGAEVYSCAADRDQARIVFGVARRMVELEPVLESELRVYRDVIEYPALGSIYRVLSSEAYTKEGLNVSACIFDEVHAQPNDDLWNVMSLAMGARTQPLLLGITTAGVRTQPDGQDSLCYRLYQYGRQIEAGEIDDPAFFFRWWSAPPEADWRDEATWRIANPALGDFLHVEDFEAAVRLTPEAEFRTKRLNQWVASRTPWIPAHAWDACASPGAPAPGTPIVLGFDGSYSGDSTALVGCTIEDGHVFVVAAWERMDSDDPEWRVPIAEVESEIIAACERWEVHEVACDPFRWQRSMEALADRGVPIVEYPTSHPARMVPACAAFYDAVMDGRLTHDGDPRLARHVANAVLKRDAKGPRITKEHKSSSRKIDLAVAAVIAYDRARVRPAPESPKPWAMYV